MIAAPAPNEAERLRALHDYAILDTAPEADFDELTELAARICRTPVALISLIDERRQWFKSRLRWSATETTRDIAFCAQTILQDDLLVVSDATRDARFAGNPLVTAAASPIRFYAGAPLRDPQGHALGALCVIDHRARKMSDDQRSALRILSRHVTALLESRRRRLEAERLRGERDAALARLERQHAELERQVQARTAELSRKADEARRLLEIAERSRLALLSAMEDRAIAEQTQREHAQRLRVLAHRLVETEEAERTHINRELHDRVGPSLAALGLLAHVVREGLCPRCRSALAGRIDDGVALIADATGQLRNVMADLRPPALDDFGLLASLRTAAEPVAARTGLQVTVRGEDPQPRVSPGAETALFRIAQEALNNAVKHARARHVEIALEVDSTRIALTVADDGVGFDPADTKSRRASWGLRSMRERAEAIGAVLRIRSTPREGTRVRVELGRGGA